MLLARAPALTIPMQCRATRRKQNAWAMRGSFPPPIRSYASVTDQKSISTAVSLVLLLLPHARINSQGKRISTVLMEGINFTFEQPIPGFEQAPKLGALGHATPLCGYQCGKRWGLIGDCSCQSVSADTLHLQEATRERESSTAGRPTANQRGELIISPFFE